MTKRKYDVEIVLETHDIEAENGEEAERIALGRLIEARFAGDRSTDFVLMVRAKDQE